MNHQLDPAKSLPTKFSAKRAPRLWQLIPVLLLLAIPTLHAGFVETFDDGGDNGDWHLSNNPNELLVIEPDGGNPGPYLHGTVDAAIPTWYVPEGTETSYFLGNFAAKRIGTVSFDLNILSGLQVPERAVTLDLKTTLGTGDFSKGVDAKYVGTDISHLPIGWKSYEFPVDATSLTIPVGWLVTKGNGRRGTDADWQALMSDVETIGLQLGKPGFFYPFSIWDLGLDNVRVTRLLRQP